MTHTAFGSRIPPLEAVFGCQKPGPARRSDEP